MASEEYKRFYIKEVYSSAMDEQSIEERLNAMIQTWVADMRSKHPQFQYRIVNAETPIINSTSIGGQSLPPAIRFVVHVAYSV